MKLQYRFQCTCTPSFVEPLKSEPLPGYLIGKILLFSTGCSDDFMRQVGGESIPVYRVCDGVIDLGEDAADE